MDSLLQNRARLINNAIDVAKTTFEVLNDALEGAQETFEVALDNLSEPSEANEATTQQLEVMDPVIEADDINVAAVLDLARDMEDIVQRIHGLNAAKDAENADLKHQLDKAKLKIGAQEMDLNARRLRVKEMEGREKKEDSNTKKLQLLYNQLELQLRQQATYEEKKDKQFNELEDLVVNLHQQINNKQAASKKLRKELKEAKRRNNGLHLFIKEQRQLFDEELDYREKMEDKIVKLEAIIEEREDSMVEQEKEIEGLEGHICYAGRAMTIVEQTNAYLVAVVDEMRASHLDLLVENGQLCDQLDETKHYIENLEARIASFERIAEARVTSSEQVLFENVRLCKKVNDSKDQIDQLEARLAFLEDSAELNSMDKSNILNENRRIPDVIDDSKHQIDQLLASFNKPAKSNIEADNDNDIPKGTERPEASSEEPLEDTDVHEEGWEEIDHYDIEKRD
jgi:chromosome segregation ATPase